jgi:hypothetical protein
MSEVFKEKSKLGIKLREKRVKVAVATETNRELKCTKEIDGYSVMCGTVGEEDSVGSGGVALWIDKKRKSLAESHCCAEEGTV